MSPAASLASICAVATALRAALKPVLSAAL
jgi:hypothetical protein